MRARAESPGRTVPRDAVEPGSRPESAAVDAALAAWRRKAGEVLLITVAAASLPLMIVVILGSGPRMGPLARAVFLTVYAIIEAAAVLRRVDYRARLWAFFSAAYLGIAVANVALPRGPYAQVGLVALPVSVLVLLGASEARIAILMSVAILVSGPLLRALPGVTRVLEIDPAEVAGPPHMVWIQAAVQVAFLASLMILLGRFHRFLLVTLAAECRAKAELEREAVERAAAQRKVEHEMRERQRLEREIAGAGDLERRRLGRELHDGVCQQVTAALLRCRALARRADRGQTLAGADFDPLSSLLAESIEEARHVALGLCPLEPEPDALAPALRALTHRMQEIGSMPCEFLAAGDVRVPDYAMAQHLYRIAQEALSNAMRHAHAGRIAVELRGTESELMLQVEDDGTGLPAERPNGGLGLRTMAYRAQVLGGELTVTTAPGGGARVACRVPRLAGAPAAQQRPEDQRWIPTS